jgi:hypothetical protein
VKRVSVLHGILVRKVIRILVAVTVIAVPGLLFTASPASASGVALICESYSSHGYCIGAPNLGLYDPVVETINGRFIDVQSQGGNKYLLAFQAAPSLCIAAANNDYLAVIHPCNGGAGVVWTAHVGPDGMSCTFENQEFSDKYLAGHNDGSQYHVKHLGASGWDYQFATDNPVISICGR